MTNKKVQLIATVVFVFLKTLLTLLSIECTPTHELYPTHWEVTIEVINILRDGSPINVICTEGDKRVNNPKRLTHLESFTFRCHPRIRLGLTIKEVRCSCTIVLLAIGESNSFSAYEYHLCGDKCRWLVLDGGVVLVNPTAPVVPSMEIIKHYSWM
ncbi:hypothetical protein QQ045_016857 [Rhodiola kirilowii]